MDQDKLPPSESHKVLPISSYELRPGSQAGTWILVVRGHAPCLNTNVSLEPSIYVQQPEYWRIEVVGSTPGGICLTGVKEYTAVLPLAGTTGTKGIELVGRDGSEQIAVPPKHTRVLSVSTVVASPVDAESTALHITATGIASSPGWTKPRLVPLATSTPPTDTLELELVADPPEGPVIQVLTPIAGTYVWEDFAPLASEIEHVTVHAATNLATGAVPDAPVPGPALQHRVELGEDDEVDLDEGRIEGLRVVSIHDSRCPTGVSCIWQGEVEVWLRAKVDGRLEDAHPSSNDDEPAALGPYRVRLVDVAPYPSFPRTNEPQIVTVVVMRE